MCACLWGGPCGLDVKLVVHIFVVVFPCEEVFNSHIPFQSFECLSHDFGSPFFMQNFSPSRSSGLSVSGGFRYVHRLWCEEVFIFEKYCFVFIVFRTLVNGVVPSFQYLMQYTIGILDDKKQGIRL